MRARFCAELGLADPGISWLTARDRGAEFAGLLALICGTLARIGGEVYELQRPEIGELREAAPAARSAASPMPHKRNPEGSEHLDTLARLARSSAAVLAEAVVEQHERDGRGWKAEWVAWPEICLLTGRAAGRRRPGRGPDRGRRGDASQPGPVRRLPGVASGSLALLTQRLGARGPGRAAAGSSARERAAPGGGAGAAPVRPYSARPRPGS